MAQIWRHHRRLAAAILALITLAFTPAPAEDRKSREATDLFDRPVLAVDPGMHMAAIWSQAVDRAGRFAVTGSNDRTVRIWSLADGKLLRTIWIPVGPERVGTIGTVAISSDGSTVAAGGRTETTNGSSPVYLFERESGNLIQRVGGDLPDTTMFLTFSPDDRFLAAVLGGGQGLRVFDRDKDWSEVFRDDQYGRTTKGAAFARDGRLATTNSDGLIRLYRYDPTNERPNFRRAGESVRAPSETDPSGVAFSPDGKRLAVGYTWDTAVDILDGTTLERVGGHRPANVTRSLYGFDYVAWSRDGQTLFAAGAIADAQGRLFLFAWDRGGLGDERRVPYCSNSWGAGGVDALPDGRILVASIAPCIGLMGASGEPVWSFTSPVLKFAGQVDNVRVSTDGKVVDFGYLGSSGSVLRFDVRSLTLSSPPPSDGLTLPPLREGLKIDRWRDRNYPTLNGGVLPLGEELARSLAIAADAKRFFLGSHSALRAFDEAGTKIWSYLGRGEVLAVNASADGRIVVAAYSDGIIRWHRAADGHELLALQVLPNRGDPAKWDWVLWTPEGFYEATPGAQDVLKWVVNHGPDKAATTLPVSAIAKLHRRNTLSLVIEQLETARAIGIDEITQARLDVQAKTGSAKPPGGVLHVLAIGINKFGGNAGGLHLDYAVEDAHDVANAILESQKGSPDKASLYADVRLSYLPNEKANKTAILDALDGMAQSMAANVPGEDVALILISTHGEMIDGQFYFVPHDFLGNASKNAATSSALSATEFAKKIQALASHGKVLLLLDACHSGAVGAQGWATDPDAKVLQDAVNLENVTVLTSSKKNELSQELPEWKHGALSQAFLDALVGAADSQGIVRLSALIDAMENDVRSLTKGRQHLGMHVNFNADLFVARRQ
jgi:WD40 repeat protein